jgi:death-on-curing family protein
MRTQKRERVGVSRVRLVKFEYLSALQLIEINNRVLKETRARKADSHRVASRTKLDAIIWEVRALEGDAFAKAASLLIGLTKRHAFDSGNRRTAYAAAKLFLEANGKTMDVEHDPRVLTGIREGFYSTEEIVEWLKGNGIRDFRRHT